MAWTKISELTELTTPTWNEELVYEYNNTSGKIKASKIWLLGGGGIVSVLSYKWTSSSSRTKSYSRPSGANYCMRFSTAASTSDTGWWLPCYWFTAKPTTSTATNFYNWNGNCYMTINNSTLTMNGIWFWTITLIFLK